MPYEMDLLFQHLSEADIFASIGTSGNVYPAAGFVAEARRAGAHTIEFNLERSAIGNQFAEHRVGPASQTVTAWVEELLSS
jgi:NAD-dependent deacetylase